MAAPAKTDLEKATDEHDKLVAEIEKLRQQAEAEEQKLLEQQQVTSVKVNVDLLEKEKARLQARLERAREATKEFAKTATPIDQAEIAQAEVEQAQNPTPDDEKGE